MGLIACQAAYEDGQQWLADLKKYLTGNLAYVREFLKLNLPEVTLIEPQGTYLVWLDFRNMKLSEAKKRELIEDKAKLWLDAGIMFGEEGKGFERINIVCPRKVLEQALNQLRDAILDITY
jgi:cystathionine beta-lyase